MATQFSVSDDIQWKSRFFTIWGGQALSLLGSQLVSFAIIWYLTVESGSATVLAIASLVALLPQVIIGPLVGPLIDRWNRRRIMVIADSIIAAATLLLAYMFAIGQVEIWQIYVLMFVRSIAGGFHGPAMTASTSLMVPVEHLTRIQGLNQMLNGGLNIVSAPLGALLLEALPLQGILGIDVVSALFAIVPLFFLDVPQPDRSKSTSLTGEEASFWGDFKAGFKYMISWKGLLIVGIMASLINFLLTPAFSLLPLLVNGYFGKDAIAFGSMEALFGIGVIAGSLLLGVWGGFKRRIITAMIGLGGIGIGTLVLGVLPPSGFTWAVVALTFLGVVQPITNGSLLGLVQAIVAPDMQGRVFTLTSSISGAMSPIGLAIAGPISDTLGKQTWFIVGGVTCILMAAVSMMVPAVMNIEDEGRAINEKGMDESVSEMLARE
ncbi:MAG: MFS transporter [Anaerolineales bacterium]|jgi:DHA3 family macrolide efflux protein-like MFS transporter